jgi:putative cell wall-binding protein
MPQPHLKSPGRMAHRGLKTVPEVLFIALLLALPSAAQNGQNGQSGQNGQNGPPPTPKSGLQHPFGQIPAAADDNIAPGDPLWGEKQLRMLNADRQKQLVADTNKLLKIAQQLDAEIAGTNPDSLTPDQLRRIAEIEKLARSVKDKMSTSVRGAPPFHPEPPPLMR